AVAPKHVRGRQAGGAAADDDDRARTLACAGSSRRRGFGQLLAHERHVALPLDAPAGDRIERRRPQRVAAAKAETGVVPGTTHGVADDESFGEWTVIVRAVRADGEELAAGARDHDILVTDPAEQRSAVGKSTDRDSLREIGLRCRVWVAHD